MGIRLKRQGGLNSCYDTAKAPQTLKYGEPAIDSDGCLYIGSGSGGIVSKVKNAAEATHADNSTNSDQSTYATRASTSDRATYDMPLYSVSLRVDGWTNGGSYYTQTANCVAVDGGPSITSSMTPSMPLTRPTDNKDTNKNLLKTLNIINMGVSTPGYGKMTVKVWEKPETDIVVYYYIR